VATLVRGLEGATGTIGVAIAGARAIEATCGFEGCAGAGVSIKAGGLTIRDDDQRALHAEKASSERAIHVCVRFAGSRPMVAHELRVISSAEMTASRLLPLCVVLISLACAGSKSPTTDDGPAASAGDSSKAADDGAAADEGAAAEEGAAGEEGAAAEEGGAQACASDADCVPAQCCHPTSCVVASAAPDCSDVACTENCQAGTMDCGQGECQCQNGSCVAYIGQSL
jgi:hypothetical protein